MFLVFLSHFAFGFRLGFIFSLPFIRFGRLSDFNFFHVAFVIYFSFEFYVAALLFLLPSCYSEQVLRVAQRLSVKPINTCQVDDFDRMSNLWFMFPTAQPTRYAHPVARSQRWIAP